MNLNSGADILCEVVRQRSFIGAARTLGITGAAVSKQIKQLELQMGLVLFHRTTRTVQPTDAAVRLERLLSEQAEQRAALLDELSSAQDRPVGRLRLNVPMSFGELFLREPIARYALRYPDVIVDVDFEDRRVHLLEEGYDLVVRIGVLEDSGLVAQKVGDCPHSLCASPDFLDEHGWPQSAEELSQMPAIIYAHNQGPPVWQCIDSAGQAHSIPLRPRFYANSAGMMREACLKGVGLAVLPEFSCASDLASGALLGVFSHLRTSPERGIYAIYPEKRFLPVKVRAFIDILKQSLARG